MIEYLLLAATSMIVALLLDLWLAEPKRWHPLVGFGRWANWLESLLYPGSGSSPKRLFIYGSLAWSLAVLPLVALLGLLVFALAQLQFSGLFFIANVAIIYLAVGGRSLELHAEAVIRPLKCGDMLLARESLSMLVSRDTSELDAEDIATATAETVLENSHDSVVGVLFWFLFLGAPGVIFFRLSNTLDAMWGYRNQRYNYFGRWAARADDILGFFSARLTVLLFSLQKPQAMLSAWRFGRHWYSPNAGPVMAAGAGALGISLGGDACYSGEKKSRPLLGQGSRPNFDSVDQCLTLARRSYFIFPLILLFLASVLSVGQWLGYAL